MKLDLEIWFFWLTLTAVIAVFTSLLVFARMSVAPIEKRTKENDLPRPCPWDGPGARIFWYAWAIALPIGKGIRADDPFIDVPLVKSYASKGDAIRAIAFMVSQALLAIVAILFGFLDIESL